MVDYIFDTSAINQLHDDSARESVVQHLLASGRVVLTGLNIIEASVTANSNRRTSLLRLQQQLSRGDRPLRIPTQIVQELTRAYKAGARSVDIAINNSEGAQLWWILHEPENIDEETRQEGLSWKAKLEGDFTRVHQRAREPMRSLFNPPPKTFGQTLQYLCRNPQSFLSTASNLFEESGGGSHRRIDD
jgi:hypothetical protein